MGDIQMDMSGIRLAIATTGAGAVLGLTMCAALATSALATSAPSTSTPPPPMQSTTVASIAPSLSPNRPHAKASLAFTMRFSGGQFGVPSPVRRSVLRLPAGLTLHVPHLSSCPAARLRARGPRGCPTRSMLGSGHALVETHAGSQTITEAVTMWVFLGPPHNLQPTFEILARGYTPLDQQMVLFGTVVPAKAPYGEELVMSIPPIPTLLLEPDASIANFTLTIGAGRRHGTHSPNSVLVPSTCPAGGLPFAAEFTYADGSTGDALATTPCPV